MAKVLELIAEAAPAFGSSATRATRTRLELEVCVARPSGNIVVFPMVAQTSGGDRVAVRENRTKSQRLPVYCPERHINRDGWLCLFWASGDDAVVVLDQQSAIDWWSAVINHLDGQLYAEKHRRWPGRARAHGDAVKHQARAEAAAAAFGPEMAKALRQGRLQLVPSEARLLKTPTQPVRLVLDGKRVFAKTVEQEYVVNLRAPCPCTSPGRPKTLRKCGKHADEAFALVDSLVRQQIAEEGFYADMIGKVACCGSMDDCPLAKAA